MEIDIRVRNYLTLLTMRLIAVILLVACLQTTVRGYGQTVSLELVNEPIEKAFKEIKSQTGYSFIYTRAQLKKAHPVSISLKNVSVEQALSKCFQNQILNYKVEDRYIVVIDSENNTTSKKDSTINISGKVMDGSGAGLLRVTVTAVKSKKGTYTNEKGEYSLKGVLENDILVFTCIGYEKEEIVVDHQPYHTITMKQIIGMLDETVIMAYGKTTKRLNTGNIGKVTSDEIAQQPVSDPLAVLHGKVAGLVVTQSSGMPGASIKIQVRGQNSLSQGSEPLIIVDGVPFTSNNQPINNQLSILTTSVSSGLSSIANINPLDIESIEILKDADATAIYGSRGANGVVLITTKKGVSGRLKISANLYTAWSKASSLPEMMNTAEYVRMRKEAIANDGFIPSSNPYQTGYAPDLLLWDTIRETNFTKLLLGNTAHSYNGHIGLSGGNKNIQAFVSAGYNKESTVFPGNMGTSRISVNNNINYNTDDKKFSVRLSSSYSNVRNNLINANISSFLTLSPNAPLLQSEDGKLNWEENGYYFDNPAAYLHHKYLAVTDNLLSNLQLDYKVLKGLTFRSSFGYNLTQVSEKTTIPIAAQIPIYDPVGKLSISETSYRNWIVEPQAEYETILGKGKLNILIGSTFSENKQNGISTDAEGYRSDNLLNSLSAAPTIYTSNSASEYKYTALFGRINYNWKQKYIANISGRRDGSSRFGPGRRFANFGAAGLAWLFHEENFMHRLVPFLSFGKLRASYGLTGNDQIGNYKYLDSWTINYYNYQGTSTLYPTGLFNPLYGWETNKKFEIGLDLGAFDDRIYLSSVYFNNRSSNQLVDYALPYQTGFSDVIKNFPALIENKGFEFQLAVLPVKNKTFQWSFSGNISLPTNKLLKFDRLSSSSYSTTYVEGQSLNLIYKLNSLGVDPSTGVFLFDDVNKDGTVTIPGDFIVHGNTDPKYYGGFRNTIKFKRFELDVFFDFKKQTGLNFLYSIYGSYYIPGFATNQPKYLLDRWQESGDITAIQKFTTITYNSVYAAKERLRYSDAVYSNASFLRLKTASISWHVPSSIFKTVKIFDGKLFISAQNLFTITGYKGTDPEVQNYYALSSLRSIAAGLIINF